MSGSSFVVVTVHQIELIDTTDPMRNAIIVMSGMPCPVIRSRLMPRNTRIDGVRYDSVWPSPVNALCVRKPIECWLASRRSLTNARYGSIVTLFAASRIHRSPAAIHNAGLNGMKRSAMLQRIAPTRK